MPKIVTPPPPHPPLPPQFLWPLHTGKIPPKIYIYIKYPPPPQLLVGGRGGGGGTMICLTKSYFQSWWKYSFAYKKEWESSHPSVFFLWYLILLLTIVWYSVILCMVWCQGLHFWRVGFCICFMLTNCLPSNCKRNLIGGYIFTY